MADLTTIPITNVHKRITSKTTTTFQTGTVVLYQLVFFVSNAGTAWTLTIQDKSIAPAILLTGTLALPSDGLPVILKFDQPLRMEGGIDVVTGGSTAGVIDVWLSMQ